MKRQKSFGNDRPSLYLVPTPIGNLSEMTPRAVEILKSVDVIACEDTRTSGQLLKHFGITGRLISCQNFNEESSSRGIVKLLQEGSSVALISDAGYPLINDPGQRVVNDVTEEGFNVIPVSGCSAFLNALVASGLVAQPFLFIGFLPSGSGDRIRRLQEYRTYPMTMVFYEAPHRIAKMLQDLLDVFGDRRCTIARELTKIHEEFLRGTVSELLEAAPSLKGEMVVVVEGNHDDGKKEIDMSQLMQMVNEAMACGMSRSEAVKDTAKRTGISKNRIYELVHHEKN